MLFDINFALVVLGMFFMIEVGDRMNPAPLFLLELFYAVLISNLLKLEEDTYFECDVVFVLKLFYLTFRLLKFFDYKLLIKNSAPGADAFR